MEELYDTIENYLHGKLPEEEQRAFTNRIAQDAELEAEVNAFRLARDVVEVGIAQSMREDFATWDRESTTTQPAKIVRMGRIRRWLAVAASVLVLVVAVAFLQWRSAQQNYRSEVLAAQYHTADLGTLRSGADSANELTPAIQAIKAKNYPLAIEVLSGISDRSAFYLNAQFLLADVYYRDEQLAPATTTLQPALTATDPLLREKAEWLHILIRLKAGRKDEAAFRDDLAAMKENPTHSFHLQAVELANTLERFWVKLVD